jgi:3-oxoacyl-[acyl-carrier protein] reductase
MALKETKDNDLSLQERVVVVTGAGSGFGAVMTRALAKRGARVAGIDIVAERLDLLASELRGERAEEAFLPVVTDVASPAACESAINRILEKWEKVDILINNAGVGSNYARPNNFAGKLRFWEADLERWQKVIAINGLGPFFLARLCVPSMIERGWGRIVNVTTNFHTMLGNGRSSYGPAKAALEASSCIWAKELEGTGVTVNVLIPGGAADTGIFPADKMRAHLLSADIMIVPILWLASTQSDSVSGFRFLANRWDSSLPANSAASAARYPVAWEQLDQARPSGIRGS